MDAGGGTVDISAYSAKASRSESPFAEVAASECQYLSSPSIRVLKSFFPINLGHLSGSFFVTNHAHEFLERKHPCNRFTFRYYKEFTNTLQIDSALETLDI